MKLQNIIIAVCAVIFLFPKLSAQESPQKSSAIYLNGFGNSMTYALTYDTRFANKPDAWGGSIGAGGFALSGDYFLSIPVQVNYLFGKKNHFFEIGAGATYFVGNMRWLEFGHNNETNSNILGTLSFMYRLQIPKGFFLRTGWTPFFGQMHSNDIRDDFSGISRAGKSYFGVQPGWMGIGLGYCIR
jgi:hypothetical protein